MASFNSVVLHVAIVILVICLILIGLAIWQSVYGDGVKWPPVDVVCPDFWTSTTETHKNNKINMCHNNLKLGKGSDTNDASCDKFNVNDYKNNCDKRKLAIKCGISWDGISDNFALQEHCNKLKY
jgi:hypothetical protein